MTNKQNPTNDIIMRSVFLYGVPDSLGLSGDELLARTTSLEIHDILEFIITHKNSIRPVDTNEIPQFSKLLDVFNVLRIVEDSPETDLDYEKLGYYFCSRNSKSGAKVKYGENHYKLAAQLGLAYFGMPLRLTELGKAVNRVVVSDSDKENVVAHLAFRIPVIQKAVSEAHNGRFNFFNYLLCFFKESTAYRRRSSIKMLLKTIEEYTHDEFSLRTLWNIVWKKDDDDDELSKNVF